MSSIGPGNGGNCRRGATKGPNEEHCPCAPQQWNSGLRQNSNHIAVHIPHKKRCHPFSFIENNILNTFPVLPANCFAFVGIREENLAKLIQHANIQDSNIIYNLQNLGCNILAGVNFRNCGLVTLSLLLKFKCVGGFLGSQCWKIFTWTEGANREHISALKMDSHHQGYYGGIDSLSFWYSCLLVPLFQHLTWVCVW